MKIAILGTRGIPNNYGGFEQFAQHLSSELVARGFQVWVYNSHTHPYRNNQWNGVNIIRCFDPEDRIGTAGQFIYDFNCIRDSRKRKFDLILQLGYTSNSIWHWMLPRNSRIVTNMDGLEWKRSKYSPAVRRFLKYAEKLAVLSSDVLISDSEPIRDYLQAKYSKGSVFIPYGAPVFNNPDATVLDKYCVQQQHYFLCIARMQSDNHIEEVIRGVLESDSDFPVLVIGSTNNKFGQYLKKQYNRPQVQFIGSLYDQNELNHLRYFAYGYFHGHSAGGTNPSLLEAMASSAMICAHDNPFNRSVLLDNALYFKNSDDIATLINTKRFEVDRQLYVDENRNRIQKVYNPAAIVDAYVHVFESRQAESQELH